MSKCRCILRFVRFLCGRGEFVAEVSAPRLVLFLPHCIIVCMCQTTLSNFDSKSGVENYENTKCNFSPYTDDWLANYNLHRKLCSCCYKYEYLYTLQHCNLMFRNFVVQCNRHLQGGCEAAGGSKLTRVYGSWSEGRAGNAKLGAIEKTKKKLGGKDTSVTYYCLTHWSELMAVNINIIIIYLYSVICW
jgi:hypothetical protein